MSNISDQRQTASLAEFSNVLQNCLTFLVKLSAIEKGYTGNNTGVGELAHIVQQIHTLLRYMQAVEDICEHKIDKKRICIKYKDLDHEFIRHLDSKDICWKYLMYHINGFFSTLKNEFEQPLKFYEYSGDTELSEIFISKLPLLVIQL